MTGGFLDSASGVRPSEARTAMELGTPGTDKTAQPSDDDQALGNKRLKPRYTASNSLKIELPRLPPAARSWPAYMAYTAFRLASLIPCRERISALTPCSPDVSPRAIDAHLNCPVLILALWAHFQFVGGFRL